ncbi:MAG TPA: alpha-isopropylmalate synthase regulatory domain-containing protein [Candidatus Paceibacterota bacterium]
MNAKESTVGFIDEHITDTTTRTFVIEKVALLENRGYSFDRAAASLELAVRRCSGNVTLPFEIVSYHVSDRGDFGKPNSHICEAIVKIRVGGEEIHKVSDGSGPIHALDGAIRSALEETFKDLNGVKLLDYSVKMLNGAPGAAANISVLIQSGRGTETWWTIGVSQNVIEASLLALVDSFEFALVHGG